MKYLCLVYVEEQKLGALPRSEASTFLDECSACAEELRESGHIVMGAALQPVAAAMTVRTQKGKASITDGPFAETKEQLGGFCLIEARDLNEAIQVASKMPPARLGCIEVRPLKDFVQAVASDAKNHYH